MNKNDVLTKLFRTFVAALCFFFLIGSYYLVKPMRKPFLFKYLGKEYLHHFYNISVVVTLLAVIGYNRLVNIFTRINLLRAVYGLIIVIFLMLAFGVQFLDKYAYYDSIFSTFYFFFVSLYVLFVIALFWSISHELHKTQEAKTFYPYIFLGGQIGVIFASKFAYSFINNNGYSTVILTAALGIVITWCLLEFFYIPFSSEKHEYAKPKDTATFDDFKIFFENRYVFFIGLIMVLATFTSTVSDQQFSWLVDNSVLEDPAFYQLDEPDMQRPGLFVKRLAEKNDIVSQKIYNHLSDKMQQEISNHSGDNKLSKELIDALNDLLLRENLVVGERSEVVARLIKEKISIPSSFLGKFFFDKEKQERLLRFIRNKVFLSDVYPGNFLIVSSKLMADKNFLKTLSEQKDPLSNYLVSFFSEQTKKLLASYDNKNHKYIASLVFFELNELIKKDSFYQKQFFAVEEIKLDDDVDLKEETFVTYKSKKFFRIKLHDRIVKELKTIGTKKIIISNKLILEKSYSQLDNVQAKLQGQLWAKNNFYMGICNILMCLIITPLLIRLFGPAISICLYPIVLLVGATFFIQELSVYTVRYFAIVALSFNYTLYKVGLEMFYVPTDKNIKYKTKAVCDTFLFRLGDAGSSLMVTIYLAMIPLGGEQSLTNLSYVVFFVVIVWIISIVKTGNLYQKLTIEVNDEK